MSKRYEFLNVTDVEVLTAEQAAEEFEDGGWEEAPDVIALVLGNPWATAAVITGTPQQIKTQLVDLIDTLDRIEAGKS